MIQYYVRFHVIFLIQFLLRLMTGLLKLLLPRRQSVPTWLNSWQLLHKAMTVTLVLLPVILQAHWKLCVAATSDEPSDQQAILKAAQTVMNKSISLIEEAKHALDDPEDPENQQKLAQVLIFIIVDYNYRSL